MCVSVYTDMLCVMDLAAISFEGDDTNTGRNVKGPNERAPTVEPPMNGPPAQSTCHYCRPSLCSLHLFFPLPHWITNHGRLAFDGRRAYAQRLVATCRGVYAVSACLPRLRLLLVGCSCGAELETVGGMPSWSLYSTSGVVLMLPKIHLNALPTRSPMRPTSRHREPVHCPLSIANAFHQALLPNPPLHWLLSSASAPLPIVPLPNHCPKTHSGRLIGFDYGASNEPPTKNPPLHTLP